MNVHKHIKALAFAAGCLTMPYRLHAEDTSPQSLVQFIEGNLSPLNTKSVMHFLNRRLDGTTAEYEVHFDIRDANHSRGTFVKPDREKGREVLRLEDTLWTFVPSVGRVVRIADRDSFAGGDFSNADILRVDWSQKYDVALLKDLTKQQILELTAKLPDAPYAKMRLWVDKASRQPVQQNYYDSKGNLLKKCLYGAVTTFGKITRPAHMVMENIITKQTSELKVLTMESVISFPDSRFVSDNLGK